MPSATGLAFRHQRRGETRTSSDDVIARSVSSGAFAMSHSQNEPSSGTDAILRAVPGEVWFTEASGLVRYTTSAGRTTYPYDPERGARALQQAFDLAGGRITRVYVYSWRAQAGREPYSASDVTAAPVLGCSQLAAVTFVGLAGGRQRKIVSQPPRTCGWTATPPASAARCLTGAPSGTERARGGAPPAEAATVRTQAAASPVTIGFMRIAAT